MKPERHGYKWKYPETNQVLNEYYRGVSIQGIAKKHKRSVRSIEYYLHNSIGRALDDMVINGINFDEAINIARKIVKNKIDLEVLISGGVR